MKAKFLSALLLVMAFTMISGTAYARKKPVLGVDEFRNDTQASWWRRGVGSELAGMLTNELGSNGKFKMVERKKLNSALKEQDLGASGRIRKGTAAKVGKLTGAQYLVMATVSSYEEGTSKRGGGFSFKGISIGGKKSKAYIAVDLRVVNTTTGDVDYFRTVEATAKSGGLSFGLSRGGFSGALGGSEKTPHGKAIRACVIEIAEYLECVMVDKDSCIADYKAKEKKRRKKTKGAISLE
ncbi:MAG TPA: penicillin-binding protein activator LpoB [Nitrospirae bacterium]|nr:penicillin-binding protein activator LpoB [Nitrospirota bacterium]